MSSAPHDCSDAHSVSRSFLWDIHFVTSSHLCRKGGDVFQQHHLVAVLKSRAWIPAGLTYCMKPWIISLVKILSCRKRHQDPFFLSSGLTWYLWLSALIYIYLLPYLEQFLVGCRRD